MEETLQKQQIKTICGVSFGISREKAESMLEKKFGRAVYDANSTDLTFNNIKYANQDFNSVIFLFQSDGINDYFYACIFVKEAKSLSDAFEKEKYFAEELLEKYHLSGTKDDNGYSMHGGGGISPLWDGRWYTCDIDAYGCAIHTDIIKYDVGITAPYAVRIIYGPYNYVNEEF